MSTQNEVNGAFPDYVNFYIHNNNSSDTYDKYTLGYVNGAFVFATWTYGFSQPTMQDLEAYTLADVQEFAQFLIDQFTIAIQSVPYIVTTAREDALTTYDSIPLGSLIYNSTTGQLKCWDGTAFKTVTFDA